MPLLVCFCSFLLLGEFGNNIKDYGFLMVCAGLVLFSTPSVIPILFIRRRLFNYWYPTALIYLIIGTIYLLSKDGIGGGLPIGISERGGYTVYLAIGFSVATLLWSIIHTLVLRHNEKKNANVKV